MRECDNHESALLEKLDKLVQKDNELVSRISNAWELIGNDIRDSGTRYQDTLKELLKTKDPNLSEATVITRRGELTHFKKKQVDLDLGEVHEGEMKWKQKTRVKLSNSMCGTASTPDGMMAVGYDTGGIEIYSAEGELQQAVLKDVKSWKLGFLSDGRCVVRDTYHAISLYTSEWDKLDVRFDSLIEGGCLAVDCDDLIYVGHWNAKKIQIFTPSGGKAIREISFTGLQQRQLFVMGSSKDGGHD